MLQVLDPSEVRENLDLVLQSAADDGNTVVINCKSGSKAALISLEKLNLLEKARENAEYLTKLRHSENQLKEGKVVVKTMEELERLAQ